MSLSHQTDRDLLLALFHTAVTSAMPGQAILPHLPPAPRGRTVVVGAGKAAAQMARALEANWPGPLSGVVVTPYGHGVPCNIVEVLEAAHPVPDAAGHLASQRLLHAVTGLSPEDLVISLISGGGSALLPSQAPGLTLQDEQALNVALLASGAPIGAMNIIRSQVSTIKGGRLAQQAAPAPVVTLIISDIPGDDASLVASGPTIPFDAQRQTARRLITELKLNLPEGLKAFLDSEDNLPPAPDDPIFSRNTNQIIASARHSLEAAARQARAAGIETLILSDAIEGDARVIGGMHAAITRELARPQSRINRPLLVLSGGETSVAPSGNGKGGRNSELLLALAQGIEGLTNIVALAADTDGKDGTSSAAGGFVDGTTIRRLRASGLDPQVLLETSDTASGLLQIGDLIETGPTGTNVNDFRAILIR